MSYIHATIPPNRQPESQALAAELDAAEDSERAASAVHDGCRARLRAARSAYRAEVRFSLTPFTATPEKLASLRQLYADLCALDIGDRPIIDAAAWIEAATGGDDAAA